MKQLKVIKSTFDSQKTSIIKASFNESVTLESNSRIWLDKLSMTILSGNTTGIVLPEQVIQLSTNSTSDAENIPFRTIIIPAGTYATVQDLVDTMNQQINAIFNSNPIQFSNGLITDIGLSVLVTEEPSSKNITIAYEGVNVETSPNFVLTNCSLTGGYFVPPNANAYTAIQPMPLIRGGLQVLFKILPPANLGANFVEFGLYDGNLSTSNPVYTIKLQGGSWYYGNSGTYTLFPDQTIFNVATATDPDTYYCFYTDPNDAGHLRFGAFDTDNHLDYDISPVDAFIGFNFLDSHFFQVQGITNGAALPVLIGNPYLTLPQTLSVDNKGYYVNHAAYIPKEYVSVAPLTLGNYPDIPQPASERTMNFVFTSAAFLANGLGFNSLGFSYSGFTNTITGSSIVGFVNYYDLALDVLNIPIQNYISSDTTTGRVNCLAYFTPQRLDENNNNVFIFENKNLTFLDIMNKEKMVVESLDFRLYNAVNPNSVLKIQGLSFNIFIDSPSDGRLVRID
jgi:hypothetical protein